MKDAGIFLGREEKQRHFLGCDVRTKEGPVHKGPVGGMACLGEIPLNTYYPYKNIVLFI